MSTPSPSPAPSCGHQPVCGCVRFCRAEKHGAGLRSGAQYIDDIRDDGRRVFIDGELAGDVTTHPAFAGAARSVANLFDIARAPDNRDLMTYTSPATGHPVNRIWQLPRSREDLAARRGAIERWSEATLGFMGRSPDHVAGFYVGFVAALEVFARGRQKFADNVLRFYEFLRDYDLYATYTIVPPQIDRSKPAHQQEEPDLYAGVVAERDDGIVIRGAQMLGTGTALSDYVHLSTIHALRPGDENYAISVAIPCNAPGVKIYSRRSYAQAATSTFDYPLASRFDETDSLLVYDNVFVPWERVFVYKNVDLCRAQWFETPAHVIGNNQAQIRFAAKLRFMVGLMHRIAEMNGVGGMPPVQWQIAELATLAATYQGLIYAQEATSRMNRNGYCIPGAAELYANMNLQAEIYPRMIDLMRELCGGGLIQLPSSVEDFANPEIARDIERYVRSPGHPARDRVRLLKLAWEVIGSEFAGRHLQYEKFYAGAPFIVRSHMYRTYDFAAAARLVDYALATSDSGDGHGPAAT
jgi:4-hydroxyphenylacetate 3-monooxygenase